MDVVLNGRGRAYTRFQLEKKKMWARKLWNNIYNSHSWGRSAPTWYPEDPLENRLEWEGKKAKTPKSCSCLMCGNPRNYRDIPSIRDLRKLVGSDPREERIKSEADIEDKEFTNDELIDLVTPKYSNEFSDNTFYGEPFEKE